MAPETLDYATPDPRRTTLRRTALTAVGFLRRRWRRLTVVLLLILLAAGGWTYYQNPWLPYGSRNGYQQHRMLTFTRPPDWVVYEEDPARAARLRALPRRAETEFVGEDLSHVFEARHPWPLGDGEYFEAGLDSSATYIPRFHAYTFSPTGAPGLTFVHERLGPGGERRMAVVTHGQQYPPRGAGAEILRDDLGHSQARRDALVLSARSGPVFGPFDRAIRRWRPRTSLIIPLGRSQVARLYAGQADPIDPSRLTIRYEIDGVAGTIEGRLSANDYLKLRVVDGPALGKATTVEK